MMDKRIEYITKVIESKLTSEDKVEYIKQILKTNNEEIITSLEKDHMDLIKDPLFVTKHTHFWIKTSTSWYCICCGAKM